MTALIDTCVILDALQGREPFREDAEKILLAAASRFQAYTTAKAVTDLWYILNRSLHSRSTTRATLRSLLTLVSVLDTTAEDCLTALDADDLPDFEDAVMIKTAEHSGIDCIVTRNGRDYASASVPVLSPAEFLEAIPG